MCQSEPWIICNEGVLGVVIAVAGDNQRLPVLDPTKKVYMPSAATFSPRQSKLIDYQDAFHAATLPFVRELKRADLGPIKGSPESIEMPPFRRALCRTGTPRNLGSSLLDGDLIVFGRQLSCP